jgi:(R,R)-butanediol dehydrogenase / meso-butanediol dehydrogenase / diacetyl reductase
MSDWGQPVRAVAIADDRSLRLVDVPEPDLKPDEVRVAVSFCGICGSDLHMRGAPAVPAGTVLGHEFTGVVTEAGPAVAGWAPGDRVTANPFDPCGACDRCAGGYPELCPSGTGRGVGLVSYPGAYAETVVVPQRSLFRLPDELSDRHGALAEPLAVGLHGISLSGAGPGDPAVVLGGGPIGVMTALGLRARGFDRVIAVEPTEVRRAALRQLGFAVSDVPGQDDNVREYLGGPPLVAFDCTGHPTGLGSAVGLVAPAGQVVVVGVPSEPSTVPAAEIATKEVRIRGSLAYTAADWAQAIGSLASGRVPADDLITTVAPLEQAEHWFGELTSGATRQIKVLLKP